MQKDSETRITYKVELKCTRCRRNFPEEVIDPLGKVQCPYCCRLSNINHKDIKEIEYRATVESHEISLYLRIDHDKSQLLPDRVGARFKYPDPGRHSIIQAFNQIGKELRDDPYWDGYDYIEDYGNLLTY